MASASPPATCRVAPQWIASSFAPTRSLAGCRAVAWAWRCLGLRRGRRRRWAGLRTRCGSGGAQQPALQPDSESTGEGLVAEEDGRQRPPFDLNLAVVLAGFAFEAYTSPPVSPLIPHPWNRTSASTWWRQSRRGLAYVSGLFVVLWQADVGWRETDAAECQTVFLSE
jgi:hypothetical protein